jgi:uncharacterized protein YwqG
MPDLPAGFDWPLSEGRPMAHIAQLRLADVTEHDVTGPDGAKRLPERGWLCFFFDATNDHPFADHMADVERPWRVVYFDEDASLLETTEPPPPRNEHNEFRVCSVGFDAELTLPSFGSAALVNLQLDEEHREDYEDLVFSLHARPPMPGWRDSSALRRWIGQIRHWWLGDPIHRMLGYPEHFQIDPCADWERMAHHQAVGQAPTNKLLREARDWRLLLQVDTYRDGPDWLWGDNGTFYFGIQAEDLAARNFDAVQWTIECG